MYRLTTATGAIERVVGVPYDPSSDLKFNDGRTDPAGRLWVGSYSTSFTTDPVTGRGLGTMYRYDHGVATAVIDGLVTANGTAFSADRTRMFRAETLRREIYVSDYDDTTGTLGPESLFATVPDTLGKPDGAAVDTQGGYWLALITGPENGTVVRFDRDGVLDMVIDLPIRMPTMVAFGGPNLGRLYITSLGDPPSTSELPTRWTARCSRWTCRSRASPSRYAGSDRRSARPPCCQTGDPTLHRVSLQARSLDATPTRTAVGRGSL